MIQKLNEHFLRDLHMLTVCIWSISTRAKSGDFVIEDDYDKDRLWLAVKSLRYMLEATDLSDPDCKDTQEIKEFMRSFKERGVW